MAVKICRATFTAAEAVPRGSREADPEETHRSPCEGRARLHAGGGGGHLLLAIGPQVWPRLGRGSKIGTGDGASGQGRACLS